MLEEHALDAKLHDRSGFQCGEPALEEYLRKYAVQQSAKGLCSTSPSKIVGFYTLSAAQIGTDQLSDVEKKKLLRYPIPCFRMGRLARSIDHRGGGVGAVLIGLAVDRCLKARVHVGAYALLVDAKSEKASVFYQQYGFRGLCGFSDVFVSSLGLRVAARTRTNTSGRPTKKSHLGL